MPGILLALAMMLANDAAPAAEPPPELPIPVGAPKDDYGLVAWCYGALGGYLDLYDRVMPEVTRIESTYRKPGTRLEDDLKTYSDLRAESRSNLKLFTRAIEAAEKASLRPISARGQEAVKKGRGAWAAAATLSDARVAQEWMGWALPAVCAPTAQRLLANAKLMGATFEATADPADLPPAEGEDAIGAQLMEQSQPLPATAEVAPAQAEPALEQPIAAPPAT
jgi:hypothetical protein